MSKSLTAVFWNVWYEVQNGKRDDGSQLIESLDRIITAHEPDFVGLNEVMTDARSGQSKIIQYLESRGYRVFFKPFSPISKDWMIGSLLASKQKPEEIKTRRLGPDTQAERRGFSGFSVHLIEGTFTIGGQELTVIVNYLGNLLPLDWGTHIEHRRSFNRLLSSYRGKNVIIGGDFNEPKYLWTWRRLPAYLRRRTGSLRSPTWRLNGKPGHLFFANYDYIVYGSDGALELADFQVLDRWPSDHAPVLGQFSLQKDL